ncbi:MAG: InlB B-repeat-containing protein, partial [Thermoplasmata archaeon]
TQWVTAGTTLNLTAVAQSGYRFTNWTGTGAGNYTGTRATINITVSGPITELAGFMPNTNASSSNSGLTGATTAAISFGLLAVLLVIGLVVAFVIRRSQGSKRTGGSKPPAATTPRSSGGSTVGSASKGQTAPASEPMTIYQGPGSKK